MKVRPTGVAHRNRVTKQGRDHPGELKGSYQEGAETRDQENLERLVRLTVTSSGQGVAQPNVATRDTGVRGSGLRSWLWLWLLCVWAIFLLLSA